MSSIFQLLHSFILKKFDVVPNLSINLESFNFEKLFRKYILSFTSNTNLRKSIETETKYVRLTGLIVYFFEIIFYESPNP